MIVEEEELIGTISDLLETLPTPFGCTPTDKSIVYQFDHGSEIKTRFKTRYYYDNGAVDTGDLYQFAADSQTECIVQNLTL